MEITEEQLQQFIALYQTELGITITSEQAQEKALALLYFVSLSMKPLAEINKPAINDMPDIKL